MRSDFWFWVLIIVIGGHFVVGFGYLIYKLSPRKKDRDQNERQDEPES